MITKEKQKGRRERDEIRIKKKFYSCTLIIYTNIYDESFIISRSKSFLDCEDFNKNIFYVLFLALSIERSI